MSKRTLFIALVIGLCCIGYSAYASAGSVRFGKDANGYANPGGCEINAEGTDMHVNCSHSDKAARVRYRFLKDDGFVRGPATITAELHVIKGSCSVRWMVPESKSPARTARVLVSPGSYCHIRSVSGSQP